MKGGLHVAQAKRASRRKRRVTTLPVLGVAGMSLSLTGGASAAAVPHVDGQPFDALTNPNIMLGEEEISDVSLSTFYVFDKENAVNHGLGVQLARGGCGHGCGCGRCGGCGCRGCRCGGGCGWVSCAGCGCGYGCCISWGRCRWWC